MRDIALSASHDLDVSTGDFVLLDGASRVRQQVLIKLKLWQGEWFLDTDFGTPYLASILGKQLTLSGAIAALRKSVLEVEGVRQITSLTYNFASAARTLSVSFMADTPYGLIEVNA
jgi:hypothetical protein